MQSAMSASTAQASAVEQTIVDLIRTAVSKTSRVAVQWVSQPRAHALKACGTQHIYVDTADIEELRDLLVAREDNHRIWLYQEVDGNTTNQPLVQKVITRLMEESGADSLNAWVERLRTADPNLSLDAATVMVYSVINGRLGLNVVHHFGAGRTWEVSLELHTGLAPDRTRSVQIGRALYQAVPGALIKVAFTPDHPHAFLIARDLEQQGVPVNFTATFSARQVVAAALLANPTRTNIFLGRLNQGLHSEVLGEHVLLAAQRHLRRLRERVGIKTQLIAASVRRWQTLPLTAGVDVYTVPYRVLKDFFTEADISPDAITPQVEADFTASLNIPETVLQKVGGFDRIARLFTVEPEFIEFLLELRASPGFATMDGDTLFQRFDDAGFGDVFYCPTPEEWTELRKGKIPDLDSPFVRRIPLDTLYSLLAIGDFSNFQDRMDGLIRSRIASLF